jgi:hypothetical protein
MAVRFLVSTRPEVLHEAGLDETEVHALQASGVAGGADQEAVE